MKFAKHTRKSPREKTTVKATQARPKRAAETNGKSEHTKSQHFFSGNQQNKGEPDLPNCEHEPLDHSKPSIRLLQVLPSISPGGLLQCRLNNNQTLSESIYTCLSYIWGDEPASRRVIINGERFAIRENLRALLNVVRTKSPRKTLCDRCDKHRSEQRGRTQPSGKMDGEVCLAARHVFVWLGDSEPLADFFKSLTAVDLCNSHVVRKFQELRSGWRLLAVTNTGHELGLLKS
ncbi:HET domain-containing protein [Paraphaeosphaeria sporulosa]